MNIDTRVKYLKEEWDKYKGIHCGDKYDNLSEMLIFQDFMFKKLAELQQLDEARKLSGYRF